MPRIVDINISDFRNLVSLTLKPGSRFNVFFGPNASGKTSILEAINVLSTNRSFRTSKIKYAINTGAKKFTLYTLVDDGEEKQTKLGIQRTSSGKATIKLDAQLVRSSSELAHTLPSIALDPSSFELLDGSPSNRRALLDWLVFHVKPEFLNSWKNYHRCLKQRNILLRRGKITRLDLKPWEELLCKEAAVMESCRAEVLDLLKLALDSELSAANTTSSLGTVELRLIDGWRLSGVQGELAEGIAEQYQQYSHDAAGEAPEQLYLAALERVFEKDQRYGYTTIGSHKHDLSVLIDGLPAAEVLSRGQKKSLIVSFYIAMAKVFHSVMKRTPLFLLDDLPSELDGGRLEWLCSSLDALQCQVFITSVNKHVLSALPLLNKKERCSWFHVKHGTVSPENVSSD